MMKTTTLNTLNTLTTMLVANAVFCQRADVEASKKTTLFEVLKYAIRKEAAALGMTETQGGFIFEEAGVFVTELNFENSKS